MKGQDRWQQIVGTGPCRLHDQVGMPGDLEGGSARPGRRVYDEEVKVAACRQCFARSCVRNHFAGRAGAIAPTGAFPGDDCPHKIVWQMA